MTDSAKPKRRLRGAGGLWVAVALLGLIYVGVWSVDRTPGKLPQQAGSIIDQAANAIPSQAKQGLMSNAQEDAATRAPGAQLSILEVRPTFLRPGPDLRETSADAGQPGVVITVGVIRDGKLSARLTYHALPPDQVVFVEQKPAS